MANRGHAPSRGRGEASLAGGAHVRGAHATRGAPAGEELATEESAGEVLLEAPDLENIMEC